jgi:hypothetical protein
MPLLLHASKIRKSIIVNQHIVTNGRQESVTATQFAVVSTANVTIRKHQENIPKLVLPYSSVKLELAESASLEQVHMSATIV